MTQTSSAILVGIKPSMKYAKQRMSMHSSNMRYSADPVDVAAQSDLIGALEP